MQTDALPTPVVDPLDRVLALRRQVELQRKLNEALKTNAHALYRPHKKQDLFHRAGTFRRRMVRAGNRFGKSQMGCAEDVAWLRNERPWYAESDPARRAGIPQRPVKLLTLTTDWPIVDKIWTTNRGAKQGKAWRYFPPDFIKSSRRNSIGVIYEFECKNGSIWRFGVETAYKNNPQSGESEDWDAIHVDEPICQDMYNAYARGLMDRGGFSWFTLTPLSEPWINDMFFEPMSSDEEAISKPGVFAIDGSTYDNPYLSPEDIKAYEDTLSEDEKQCRIHGRPLYLAGLIYKEFSLAKHVLRAVPKGWKSYTEPPDDWCIYLQIDPHPQTPHCVLFLAVSPSGHRIYFYDIFKHCKVHELAADIKRVVGGRRLIRVECDWLAWDEHPVDDTCMATEFARCGLNVEKATRALEFGILETQKALAAEPQLMWIAPTCRRLLWEIQRYSWDLKGENKPIDKDDHACECLYRSVLMNPVWVDTQTNNPVEDIVIDSPEFDLEPLTFSL